MAKLLRFTKRTAGGLEPLPFTFQVIVYSASGITVADMGAELRVAIERGSNRYFTVSELASASGGVLWDDDTLIFESTLYRSPVTGEFEPKSARLVVEQAGEGGKWLEIAFASINLSSWVDYWHETNAKTTIGLVHDVGSVFSTKLEHAGEISTLIRARRQGAIDIGPVASSVNSGGAPEPSSISSGVGNCSSSPTSSNVTVCDRTDTDITESDLSPRGHVTELSPPDQVHQPALLVELMQRGSNQICADCSDPAPRWVSVLAGVFVCMQCASVHRALGIKTCRVLSLDLDAIPAADIIKLGQVGNARFNQAYERYIPVWNTKPRGRNATHQARDRWIRAKYEDKAFTTIPITRQLEATGTPQRLLDFFFVVEASDAELAQWFNGDCSDSFTPQITDRYPAEDTPPSRTLPQLASNFCFPQGITCSTQYIVPSFFTFVLTGAVGARVYGAALILHEPVGHAEMYIPKALCLLSHYAVFDALKSFLRQLYCISQTADCPLPIERHITNIVDEVPLPPQGKTRVVAALGGDMIQISRPPPNAIPTEMVPATSFRALFQCLAISDVLLVFSWLLAESRIMLISRRWSILTPVAEALKALLFPLTWEHTYVPVLPTMLVEVLHAPVPFLIGVNADLVGNQIFPGTVVVDLDTSTVSVHPDVNEPVHLPALPRKEALKLQTGLMEHADVFDPSDPDLLNADVAFSENEHLQPITMFASDYGILQQPNQHDGGEDATGWSPRGIRATFLRFFVALLQNYRKGLRAGGFDPDSPQALNKEPFIEQQPEGSREFLTSLVDTLMFHRFAAEAVVRPLAARIQFFDESIIAKLNRSVHEIQRPTPFLDDRTTDHSSVYWAPTPNWRGVLPQSYGSTSGGWPRLSPTLFGSPRGCRALFPESQGQEDGGSGVERAAVKIQSAWRRRPVSYTHLTLPTKRIV
eukprot:TRINITY_DN16203_c0_g1_i2.p1 TRINITY_DN16203_c0_g1~~TRINITY_DN16203_c0_g1_i2.p1  ORF type:complete len:930 (-),score=172.04 TRINITY_DN16203_c0_g1_i2:128-2917(-)